MYNFVIGLWRFIISMFNAFEKLWNSRIDLGIIDFTFQELATTSLLVAIGWLFVKKFIL